MTLPSYVLGLIYALLLGALFHLWRDGGVGRLLMFLGLSLIGAAVGQWVAMMLKWYIIPIGPLYMGPITLGSLLFMGAGYWLSLVEIHPDEPGRHKV